MVRFSITTRATQLPHNAVLFIIPKKAAILADYLKILLSRLGLINNVSSINNLH